MDISIAQTVEQYRLLAGIQKPYSTINNSARQFHISEVKYLKHNIYKLNKLYICSLKLSQNWPKTPSGIFSYI